MIEHVYKMQTHNETYMLNMENGQQILYVKDKHIRAQVILRVKI